MAQSATPHFFTCFAAHHSSLEFYFFTCLRAWKSHQEDYLEFPSLQFPPKSFKSSIIGSNVGHLHLRHVRWLSSILYSLFVFDFLFLVYGDLISFIVPISFQLSLPNFVRTPQTAFLTTIGPPERALQKVLKLLKPSRQMGFSWNFVIYSAEEAG